MKNSKYLMFSLLGIIIFKSVIILQNCKKDNNDFFQLSDVGIPKKTFFLFLFLILLLFIGNFLKTVQGTRQIMLFCVILSTNLHIKTRNIFVEGCNSHFLFFF